MKRLLVCSCLSISFLFASASDTPAHYIKTDDGVIITPVPELAGNSQAVKLQVIADNIIRVIATPHKQPNTSFSLSNNLRPGQLPQWQLEEQGTDKLVLKTSRLTVIADVPTGTLSFYDASGKPIVSEKKMGRRLLPVVHEGKRSYNIEQVFELKADDAIYGLGQHQDGLMDYRGNQVLLFQNNTEVAVPFILSNNNYGILWENSSITRAGDIRPYKLLNALQLFDQNGEAGWLTASYYNSTKSTIPDLQRAESDISCEYLGDSKIILPAAFKPETGKVIWKGSIASGLEGVHKLRFTYGGYIKVWIDGKLVLDRWRQCWNPASAIADFQFQKNKKYTILIDWIPDGGESYISFKWQEPIAETNKNNFGFSSEAGAQEEYYIITGNNMDDVIAGYRQLTGKVPMLPLWAYGFWQSRERYKTQDEVLGTVSEFRKRKIPLDNIVLDWNYWKQNEWGSQEFDPARFPNPDSMIQVLHKKYNTHFMISVWPKFYEGIKAYNEFDKKGWLYKRNIAERQRDWIGDGYVSTFYDPFNEAARKGFWNLLNEKLYNKGVDAWWMDASEPDILSNVSPEKRKEQMYPLAAGITAEYLNAYPLENAKGIYEGQRATNPNKRVFILTRSAFSGMQRYATVTWSGDISSNWHDMQLQIAAGVNFSMSGQPYWTMDAGGFAVEKRFEKPNAADLEEWRELTSRWCQFAAFVPMFRVHGQFPYREIYNTAPENHPAYQSILYYIKLRYRMLPYIYTLAAKASFQDYTLMRGLAMDFPADKNVNNIATQYMFGPSLLVNPVTAFKATNRQVYLPAGQGWYDFYTGRYFAGGQTITADAPYQRIPLFVKEGSILPLGPELQYTTEKKADTITLCVYPGSDASFTLYEDEGTSYNYEKGEYSTIDFTYTEKNKTLTVAERKGSFPGMLLKRVFKVQYISKKGTATGKPQMINYTGKAKTISIK
ncbi:MAG TPA: glycoside hydrolase family 31 protein [Ferruginibacter sp.]|nr:glycoside hydrolase family 31 protein [Ferruginibacter sp.]HMP21122.1 glycoside hydrolase family 31 protein [Ferruginibacter sp.]